MRRKRKYLCSILDGCSRYIVNRDLRKSMTEADIEGQRDPALEPTLRKLADTSRMPPVRGYSPPNWPAENGCILANGERQLSISH
jgi:hypothetical protein